MARSRKFKLTRRLSIVSGRKRAGRKYGAPQRDGNHSKRNELIQAPPRDGFTELLRPRD